jgi:hypothetical protein
MNTKTFLTLALLSLPAFALAAPCEPDFSLLAKYGQRARSLEDRLAAHGIFSSAELEMLTDSSMPLLTTTDGTVGAIFEALKREAVGMVDLPPEALKRLGAKTYEDLMATGFDGLTPLRKKFLLKLVGEHLASMKITHEAYRNLPGFKVKEVSRVKLVSKLTVNGITYGPGWADLPTGKWFSNKVEYALADRDPSMVELHFVVQGKSPSQATKEAGDVRLRFGGDGKRVHHLNTGVPVDWKALDAEGDVDLGAYRATEALYRADWVHQILGTFQAYRLREKKFEAEGVTYTAWGVRKATDLPKLFDYAVHRVKGEDWANVGTDFKLSYVSPRDSAVPGQQLLEFRFAGTIRPRQSMGKLSEDHLDRVLTTFLDQAEHIHPNQQFGLSDAQIQAWKRAKIDPLPEAERSKAMRNATRLLSFNDLEVAVHSTGNLREEIEKLHEAGKLLDFMDPESLGRRMLLYDYSNHPAFYVAEGVGGGGQPLLERIRAKQIENLEAVRTGTKTIGAALGDFLKESGVAGRLLESLGHDPAEIEKAGFAAGLPR